MRRVLNLLLAIGMVSAMLLVSAIPAFAGGEDDGDQQISAKALNDHECDSSEWHFVITQIEDQAHAPSSITVDFSGGDSEVVLLDSFTGKTAHYTTTSHLGETVVSATATIYGSWDGQFNLSHGPCGEEPPPECIDYDDRVAEAFWVEGGTATFTIWNDACDEVVSFSSYDLPGGFKLPYEDQVLFDNLTRTVSAGQHYVWEINLPDCNWQTDLYWGEAQDHAPHPTLLKTLEGKTFDGGVNRSFDLNEGNECEQPPGPITVGADCQTGVTVSGEGTWSGDIEWRRLNEPGIQFYYQDQVLPFTNGVPPGFSGQLSWVVNGDRLIEGTNGGYAEGELDCGPPPPTPDPAFWYCVGDGGEFEVIGPFFGPPPGEYDYVSDPYPSRKDAKGDTACAPAVPPPNGDWAEPAQTGGIHLSPLATWSLLILALGSIGAFGVKKLRLS
ncbi:MAG TPA: hypothetical protein VGA08_00235 [Candidatus Saccharimonadales bacterium]